MPNSKTFDNKNTASETFTLNQLTGKDDSNLIPLPTILIGVTDKHSTNPLLGHPKAIDALLELQALAEKDRQAFQVISSYRSYQQQRNIWNRKYSGESAILNAKEQPVDISELEPLELIQAIMLYSALPGASRHHWGTDFDIFPRAAIKAGHRVQLLASEFSDKGIAAEFNQWVAENLNQAAFFRPYAKFQQGIAYEPWHISYYPLANEALGLLSKDKLLAVLEDEALEASECICSNLDRLYTRYINNICSPDRAMPSQ